MKKISDPCIGVCMFEGVKGWCLGCGRSRKEIRDWKKLKPYDKTKIIRELPRRLAKIRDK